MKRLGAAIVVASMLAVAPAAAQCPIPRGASPSLAERSTEERMRFILERTQHAEEVTRTWTTVFSLSYLGLVAAQMGLIVIVDDPGARIDFAIGAVGSMIGVASLAIFRAPVLVDRASIEELAPRAMSGDCAALAEAEAFLEADASNEDFGTSWLIHVGNVVFNLGIGLVMGLGYDRWISGAISAGVGILVGEVQILTRPTRMLDTLRRYQAGELGDDGAASLRVVPIVSPAQFGVGVSASF